VSGTPKNAGYSLRFVTIEGGWSSDTLRFSVADGNGNTINCEYPDSNLNENEWYHIAGVLDRNSQKIYLYVNGVEVDNKDLPDGFGSLETNIPVGIGALHRGTFGATTEYFNGTIDEVRILNRSLTAEEIKEDYRSTKSEVIPEFPTLAIPTVTVLLIIFLLFHRKRKG
ncbi:MAG: LamG-like jellyroll fold domain-containing protein, partial [Methanosarcinales archaeon]